MKSFHIMFEQMHGHVNVPQKYPQDGQLGSWVANIRSKRKQMTKRGEEFEIDFADDEISSDGEDDGNNGSPAKKRKRSGGRQKLTQERIVSTIQGYVAQSFSSILYSLFIDNEPLFTLYIFT